MSTEASNPVAGGPTNGPGPDSPSGAEDPGTPTAPSTRSARRQFCSTTLGLEAMVVFFAALVAMGLRLAPLGTIWALAAGLIAACLLAAGMMRRRVGIVLGSVAQLGLLACGPIIPDMYVLGAVFTALWIASLVVGGRIDRERAERAARPPLPA